MKKLSLLLLFIMCTVLSIDAQKKDQYIMEGIVYDDLGETLPGVNVYLKDRPGVGTSTSVDGVFSIKANRGDVMVFSFIGFEDFEYPVIKEDKKIRVKMQTSSIQLEEAVVTAMGSQRKVSVTGAISAVDTKDLQVPATSINNMLGGRVAGVISMQNSGEPGKNISDFWIRGIGTFGANSSALVLIDGLEGNLSQVDPADVESFSILKDASATAVYGVRGANGVVIVTTKRGQEGKLNITARANVTLSHLNRMPNYVDGFNYANLANEASALSGKPVPYSDMELDLIKYNLDPDLYPNINWQDEILNRTSWQQTYYLSARGGGSVARYFISLGMSNESTAYKLDDTNPDKPNVGYNTYNYRSNIDVNITKSTTLYMGVDGYISHNPLPGQFNTDLLWGTQQMLTPLTVPKVYSTGQMPSVGAENTTSPHVLLNYTGQAKQENYNNMITLALNQDFSQWVDGLKLRLQGALNNNASFFERRYKLPELYSATGRSTTGELMLVKKYSAVPAQFTKTESQYRKYHFEAQLDYNKVIHEDHRVGGLLYYYMNSASDTRYMSTSMQAIAKKYQGVSARVSYGYKDTYMIDGNFGYTGSENFRPGQQYGFFPSVAGGWVVTNYDWVKDKMAWMNFFKVRASYGQVGNDRISDDRFPYLTIVGNIGAGWAGEQGIGETLVGADNLAWEKSTKFNVGVDARFLDDRLNLTVDYFTDKRDGIFQKRTQVPGFVGAVTLPYGNVGKMNSWGSDGNISFTQNFGKGNFFTIRGNFTYSNNDVKHWEQAFPKYEYQAVSGRPYNVSRGYVAMGLFRDSLDVMSSPKQFGAVRPGDIKYKDVNGDGVVNSDDQVPLSYSPFPRVMYGFGGEVKLGDFTINVLFKGTGKSNFFYGGAGYIPFIGGKTGNVLDLAADQKNRWTPEWYSGDPSTENPNAKFPRMSYGRSENNDQVSTFWMGDAKYLRLQELGVTYNLKVPALKKYVGISSMDLQLIGYNLLVWDDVKIWDPELAGKRGGVYPIPARYAFQVYVNF